MKPARDARRKRGDDDLVERTAFDLLLHRGERIAITVDPLDVGTGGLVEQRQGELERVAASSVSESQNGRGTSRVKLQGERPARARTSSSSLGVAAVR